MDLQIRSETPKDFPEITTVHFLAFGQPGEADLVTVLRQHCPEFISFVAVVNDRVIGHVLFTPVTIETPENRIQGMGLAPLAVLPDYQRQGVGSQLVRVGLKALETNKQPFVVVLGEPHYYSRFGFVAASIYDIESEYEGLPEGAFMILVLQPSVLEIGVMGKGIAKYRSEFLALAA
jgi:putative acetyltransferase